MRVITRKRLVEFGGIHPDARQPLAEWYALASKGRFSSFNVLKQTFGAADQVGKFTVFDIGGNKYRLIAAIHELKTRFAQPVRVDELAAISHMSSATFHRQFKATTGMSPLQYQKELRLLEARRLMLANCSNVETV